MQLLQKIREIENRPYQIPHFLKDKHIPSLDGWRAIAIFFVLISHIRYNLDEVYPTAATYLQFLPIGNLGVRIFFVISGFLITSLLIKEKLKHGSINIKHFFIRRCLRIFPLIWLYLLTVSTINIFIPLGLTSINCISVLLYITNFTFNSNPWIMGHTWSLSVEEQFYLLWPLMFKRIQKIITITIILAAIGYTLRATAYLYPKSALYTLSPFLTEATSIFTGALLAILLFKFPIATLKKSFFNPLIIAITITIVYTICLAEQNSIFGKITLTIGRPIVNMAIAYWIVYSIYFTNTNTYRALNRNMLVKIGIMSYSIYIWQQLFLLPKYVNPSWHETFFFPLNILVTFGIAYLSYNYFEKPFLKLKTKFSA